MFGVLKKSDRSDLVSKLIEEITVAELKQSKKIFSGFIFPFSPAIADRSYSQYLLINLIGTRLQASILCFLSSNEPIIAPLPDEWIDILESNGIKVNKFVSKIKFKVI